MYDLLHPPIVSLHFCYHCSILLNKDPIYKTIKRAELGFGFIISIFFLFKILAKFPSKKGSMALIT